MRGSGGDSRAAGERISSVDGVSAGPGEFDPYVFHVRVYGRQHTGEGGRRGGGFAAGVGSIAVSAPGFEADSRAESRQPERPSEAAARIVTPNILYTSRDVAFAYGWIGNFAGEKGDWSEAGKQYDQSIAIYKEFVERSPTVAAFSSELARRYQIRVDMAKRAGERDVAVARSRDAVEFWKRLAGLRGGWAPSGKREYSGENGCGGRGMVGGRGGDAAVVWGGQSRLMRGARGDRLWELAVFCFGLF